MQRPVTELPSGGPSYVATMPSRSSRSLVLKYGMTARQIQIPASDAVHPLHGPQVLPTRLGDPDERGESQDEHDGQDHDGEDLGAVAEGEGLRDEPEGHQGCRECRQTTSRCARTPRCRPRSGWRPGSRAPHSGSHRSRVGRTEDRPAGLFGTRRRAVLRAGQTRSCRSSIALRLLPMRASRRASSRRRSCSSMTTTNAGLLEGRVD